MSHVHHRSASHTRKPDWSGIHDGTLRVVAAQLGNLVDKVDSIGETALGDAIDSVRLLSERLLDEGQQPERV